ncbi:MAG: hypothetical protein ACKPKO_41265, partial [Candidatus Fonsibacter sp.]
MINLTEVDRHLEMEKETVRDGNAELISHRDNSSWSKIANVVHLGKTHACVVLLRAVPGLRFEISGQTYFVVASSDESTAHVT